MFENVNTAALGRAIIGVLSYHVGRSNAIGRDQLVERLSAQGHRAQERVVREAIKRLRRDGHLICSMPGNDGGYYMAADHKEFTDFDRMEFSAKISDMNETRRAMLEAARRQFGDAVQINLF